MTQPDVILLHADCIEAMRTIASSSTDMLLTDPPYATTCCKWDTPLDLQAFWTEVNRVVKSGGCKALFSQTPFDKVLGCSNLKQLRYEWIWEKAQATGWLNAKKMPMKAHENILIFYDRLPTYHPQMTHGHKRKVSTAEHKRNCRRSDVYGDYDNKSYDSTDRYPRDVLYGKSDKQHVSIHPTQKAVWLCEYLIRTYSDPGDVVLDPCMGSASIGVAALKNGRKYIGIDNDEHWFQAASERLSPLIKEHHLTLEMLSL